MAHRIDGRAVRVAERSPKADGGGSASRRRVKEMPLGMRLLMLSTVAPVAVLGAGALASFALAVLVLVRVVRSVMSDPNILARSVIIQLLRAIDASLLGVVMIILAFGIYQLIVARPNLRLPQALIVESMREVEQRVMRTVVIILGVSAVEAILEPADTALDHLWTSLGAASTITAIVLFLRFRARVNGRPDAE